MNNAMNIGKLAAATNTPVETIRYYERSGLMPPAARSTGNYRVYTPADAERLAFIRQCRALDMSLDEIRTLLGFADAPAGACAAVNTLLDEHIGHVVQRIDELRRLERQLRTLRKLCHENGAQATAIGDAAAPCGILAGLAQPGVEEGGKAAGPASAHLGGTHARRKARS
jgi:Cd(II)/Pb(II)-responsive transcriptional regulator